MSDNPGEQTSHDVVASKRLLRTALKRERMRGPQDEVLVRRVFDLPEFACAQAVFTYLDVGSEVPTRGIVSAAWKASKVVCLPYCVPGTRRMTWHRIESFEGLKQSRMGIWEPVPAAHAQEDPQAWSQAIALVPGLSFDVHGYRLGYGGGFYDAFLSAFAGTSVGLCREAQLVESLAARDVLEPHDRAVDLVITESRTLRV